MRKFLVHAFAITIFAGTGLTAAMAADFPDVPLISEPAPMPVEGGLVPNCYVRGDIGYAFHLPPHGVFGSAMALEDYKDTFFYEAGLGCGFGHQVQGSMKDAPVYVGSALRTDITLGYRPDTEVTGEPPADPMWADISTWTLMANLYYDFQRPDRFTPYIGAGAGVAFHSISGINAIPTPSSPLLDNEDTAFAWQVTAGVGYQISDNLMLDMAYRYIDLGSVDAKSADGSLTVEWDGLAAHELKVGLRYGFDLLW